MPSTASSGVPQIPVTNCRAPNKRYTSKGTRCVSTEACNSSPAFLWEPPSQNYLAVWLTPEQAQILRFTLERIGESFNQSQELHASLAFSSKDAAHDG